MNSNMCRYLFDILIIDICYQYFNYQLMIKFHSFITITVFLLAFQFNVNCQIISIPDINFKNHLIENGVDINEDGRIEVSESL